MKNLALVILLLILGAAVPTKASALGIDFTKNEIAAAGKHCVHGFWVNEQSVIFYAGDSAQLNRDLRKCLERDVVSRKVIIHVGEKRVASPWDNKPRDTFADWSVNTWDLAEDAAKATPRYQMQVDIWLGSTIKLQDLQIPEAFDVVSGGEIDNFIKRHKQKSN